MIDEQERILLLPAPRKLRRPGGIFKGHFPVIRIDPSMGRPQSFRITLSPDKAEMVAADLPALRYCGQAFIQLIQQSPRGVPCVEIEDWPDFPVRGLMLDISRDKVPTMETAFQIVDQMAVLRLNQLQLYTEHTFAYAGHEEVWGTADPMTPSDIALLDLHCSRNGIELVPNQNSLGHMERWLKRPRYLPLAEAPDGADSPWGFRWPGPFSLCPTDPRSLDLLADLYDQLLPNFSSHLFNVGCDETFDIGQGRSRAACQQRGVGAVYAEFLQSIRKLAATHGKNIQFWADMILKHPESAAAVPKGAIALDWGYEADHPFEAETQLLRQSGIPFYVCPGTSSWCSIAGRTDNMLANQIAAAEAGLKNGAIGYLNTDWGDYGHLQYWPFSLAGIAAGAALSWCAESNRDLPLADLLNLHVFHDRAGAIGQLALDLGNVYRAVGPLRPNRSALFDILVPSSTKKDPMHGITLDGLNAAEHAIDGAMASIGRVNMNRPDAALIKREFQNAAAMLRHVCRKGRWKLGEKIEPRDLRAELGLIINAHRACWLARNRPGGLDDSINRLRDPVLDRD